MLTTVLLFIIISSGSIFAATFFNKKYEEILPISIFTIVTVIYICGLCSVLKLGVYAVSFLAASLYISSIIYISIKKCWNTITKQFFTPAFFIFILLYILLIFINYGKLSTSWDDFSHWALVVKEMFYINDFGTNHDTIVFFRSYPPIMAIFQYLTQYLNGEYVEWLSFFSYQVFSISLFLPFLKKKSHESIFKLVLITLSIFCLPTLFFTHFYKIIYIDGFLGLLFGFGLAVIFTNNHYNTINLLYLLFTIILLPLTKDAGLLFSIFLLIAFAIDLFSDTIFEKKRRRKQILYKFILLLATILLLILSKTSWYYEVLNSHSFFAFSKNIDLNELISVLSGKTINYKSTVVDNFFNKLFSLSEGTLSSIVLLSIASYLLYKLFHADKRKLFLVWIIIISFIIYTFGLLTMYMFKFHEFEAIQLASFDRYMNILFLSVLMFIGCSIFSFRDKINFRYSKIFIGICIIFISYFTVYQIKEQKIVISESIKKRMPYKSFAQKAMELTQNNKNIKYWLISQEDTGFDWIVLAYELRPQLLKNNGWRFSLGKAPYYPEDLYSKNFSDQEWISMLTKEYDYLLIWKSNIYFKETYQNLFENSKEIHEKGIYKINKKNSLLEYIWHQN